MRNFEEADIWLERFETEGKGIRDNGKHYMCQVLPPLLKPDYPKQTFLEKAPPPTLHIKLAVSHILKAMKPKFPQIKPYLASLGIVENPYYGEFNLKVCVKCDNLSKNLPLLYLHI